MSFDEDPLDLLEDDGDGVVEMGLFFDDDGKGNKVPEKGNSGCSIALFITGGSLIAIGYGISRLIT